MIDQIDHNKLLKKIAKKRLKPFGIFQKGQSRLFLYDKGWYSTIIEFQPSSYGKGTFLNIGVDLHFYPRKNFAFCYGYREKGFVEFKDEEQFDTLVNELCDFTIIKVKELDIKFQDCRTALKTMENATGDSTWRLYELAVLNVLSSNFDQARKQLIEISEKECVCEWEIERKHFIEEIINLSNDNTTFFNKIINTILITRQLKKLPLIKLDNIEVSNESDISSLKLQ